MNEYMERLQVLVDSLRTMHVSCAQQLALGDNVITQIDSLLKELERLLEGVKYLGELSPRSQDALVSFGERLSVRMVAATLNKLGQYQMCIIFISLDKRHLIYEMFSINHSQVFRLSFSMPGH